MNRMRLTPEVIGRSMAVGLFWGGSATVGLQLIGIAICWGVARRIERPFNVAIAVILTNITNPFTMAPAYSLFTVTGCTIVPGCMGGTALVNDLVTRLQAEGAITILTESWYLLGLAFVGSLPYAIALAIGGYLLGRYIGRKLDARRNRRVQKRADRQEELDFRDPPPPPADAPYPAEVDRRKRS